MAQNNGSFPSPSHNLPSPNVKPAFPDFPEPEDPLRVPPKKGAVPESPHNPSISNVGAADLDPFARAGPSGGMLVNPKEHPLFADRDRDRRSAPDAFQPSFDPISGARLPSWHPPGARFDAYSPFKDQRFGPEPYPRPFGPDHGGGSSSVPGEPDFDEFIPQKGNKNFDNMFM